MKPVVSAPAALGRCVDGDCLDIDQVGVGPSWRRNLHLRMAIKALCGVTLFFVMQVCVTCA